MTDSSALPQPARRICVICNEGSGRNSREADAIGQAMEVLGKRAELRAVKGDAIEATARQAADEDFDAIVAAGGDGTIMTVAGTMLDQGRRFGVLPMGTFNYFARGLGIPEDPRAAAQVIVDGTTRPVSLAEVNGHVFINNISLGLYPAILRAREDVYARWGRRRLAAHWSAAKTFLRFQRSLFLTIRADGEERRVRTPLLFVARSAYQLEEFGLAGADCVAEGRFAVFVTPEVGRAGLFGKAARLMAGSMAEGRDFELICATEVTIATRSPHLTVACDGEQVRLRTPLRLRIHPDALQVFAPPVAGQVAGEAGMRRILHLSDLHFGRTRPDLLDPLVRLCAEIEPDLVAVSGDFTQRARRGQFVEARRFLDRLQAPWLAVPGNHDISLDNVLVRLLDPWGRYRALIHADLSPRWEDDEVTVVGLNTVNRYAHQAGRFGRSSLKIIAASAQANPQKTLVVMMHHPPEHPAASDKRPMSHVGRGVKALMAAGADIVLSGHLHNAHVAPLTAAPGILLVQAGTGLSTRTRAEPNTLNLLTIEPGHVRVDRYAAAEKPEFAVIQTAWFGRDLSDPASHWQVLAGDAQRT